MPIFEYECKKCGEVTEFLESAAGNEKHECPKCASTGMERLLSTFNGRVSTESASSGSSSCPTGTCPLS